ncbi:MAG TPA: DUF1648 domain-containing protein [Chloroflexota bacterium]
MPAWLQRIDRLFAGFGAAAILLDAATWLYIWLRQPSLPDVLPVHYNTAGQVDRVGFRSQLFILPAIGLLTLVVNGFLAYRILPREPHLGYVLLSVSVLVQLLLIGAAVQLVH